jgi:hypothetical protein
MVICCGVLLPVFRKVVGKAGSGLGVTVGSGKVLALPLRTTDDVVPGAALCVRPTVPARVPDAVGVNLTTMVQVSVAASVMLLVQLELASRVNCAGETVRPVKVRLALPAFLTVKVLVPELPTVAVRGNEPVGVISISGAAAALTLPFKATFCGLPAALWVMAKLAL